jgi:hypothetical protein
MKDLHRQETPPKDYHYKEHSTTSIARLTPLPEYTTSSIARGCAPEKKKSRPKKARALQGHQG